MTTTPKPNPAEGAHTLKPCPFCGGKAGHSAVRDGRVVFCRNRRCSAHGPKQYHGPTTMPSALKRAIDAWNTRPIASAPSLKAALEYLSGSIVLYLSDNAHVTAADKTKQLDDALNEASAVLVGDECVGSSLKAENERLREELDLFHAQIEASGFNPNDPEDVALVTVDKRQYERVRAALNEDKS